MLNKKDYKITIARILCMLLAINMCVCIINIAFDKSGLQTAWAAEEEKYETEHTETFIVYAIERNNDGSYNFSYMNANKNSNRWSNFKENSFNKTIITPAKHDKLEIVEKPFGGTEYKLYIQTP